jgi:WD40 repeat protein
VSSVAFSADDKVIVSVAGSQIKLWNVEADSYKHTLEGHG